MSAMVPALTLHGTAHLGPDGLVLDGGGHASTGGIDLPLGARTLTAWVRIDDLEQQGGGVVSVQNRDGGQFDALVFGERRKRRWVPGSDNFKRTADLDGADETGGPDPVHLVLSYAEDGTVTAYRNGEERGAQSAMMWPVAKPMADADIDNLAAYLSSL